MRRVPFLFFAALVSGPGVAWPQGNPLGPEFRVNTYTTNTQGGARIAADASGNFVVVWSSIGRDGSGYGLFGQRYASSGVPLGPEFRVNTYTTGNQVVSSAAAASSGNFVVVWNSDQDSYGGVFGQRYASSGAPLGPEFRVNTYTTYWQNAPSVASDTSGNFVVVWSSYWQDGLYTRGVFGQRYASSGAPLGPEFRVNTSTTNQQYQPSVAADSSGNFVVVWWNTPGATSFAVLGHRYASSGAPLGPEFRVNTYTTNLSGTFLSSGVAADTSGNFVVVWKSFGQDGSNWGVFGQRYASSGVPLGPEFRVNTYTTFQQRYPSVAADSAGNFVVVWDSLQDGSLTGVFGQRYASSGTPLGPEFRVNTHTTNYQVLPSVASDPAGNFVVVWSSNYQDGSYWGVFGQRYSQIVPVELMHFRVE